MSTARKLYQHSFQSALRLKNLLLARVQLVTGFYRHARGSRIIVYHGICEKHPLRFNTLFVTRDVFEKELLLYKKYCHIVSLEEYYEKRFHPDKFNICISFDDGFAGAYTHALPLLEKYGIPASFFITAIRDTGSDILWNDFLSLLYPSAPHQIRLADQVFRKHKTKYTNADGITLNEYLRSSSFETRRQWMEDMQQYTDFRKNTALEDYWLQMNAGQIRKLSDSPLVTIGSHGYYHNDLAHDDEAILDAELHQSKQFLESSTGKKINALAFPYGSYSKQVVERAKRAGYTRLLATAFLSDSDQQEPALRERMGINPFIDPVSQLRAIIKGNYA